MDGADAVQSSFHGLFLSVVPRVQQHGNVRCQAKRFDARSGPSSQASLEE